MKNNLPESWAVQNDGSLLFKNEVIRYLESMTSYSIASIVNYHYGIRDGKPFSSETLDSYVYTHTKKITLQEFIELKNSVHIPKSWYLKVNEWNMHSVNVWLTRQGRSKMETVVCQSSIPTPVDFSAVAMMEGDIFTFVSLGDMLNSESSSDYSKLVKEELTGKEITYEFFVEHIFKPEKIIGYKLIKPEYHTAADLIASNEGTRTGFSIDEMIKAGSYQEENLKKAEVLNTWFESIYEDYFVTLDLGTGMDKRPVKIYKDKFEVCDEVYPIEELKSLKKHWKENWPDFILNSSKEKGHQRHIQVYSLIVGCMVFDRGDIEIVLRVAATIK